MNQQLLEEATALAEEVGRVFIATAAADGLPHVATAGSISLEGVGRVAVSEWFCPGTMANLEDNSHIALVAWDPEADKGYQLLGRVVEIRDRAVMDGYAPETDEQALPQVERELEVRVEQTLHFSQGPHSDEPE